MRHDLSAGLRLIGTRPVFSIAIVTTLAVAIAATAAVYGVLDGLLIRPLPFAEPHRIVHVADAWPMFVDGVDGEPSIRSPALSRLAQFEVGRVSLDADEPRILRVARVTRDYFSVLGIAPAAGTSIGGDAAENADGIVLASVLARSISGEPTSALGRSIVIGGRSFVVRAVMPPHFAFQVRGEPIDAWVPFAGTEGLFLTAQTEGQGTIGRLATGLTLDEAQARTDAVLRGIAQQRPEWRLEDDRIRLLPLRDHWYGSLKTPLLMLLGAAGCLLLIACANTAGLLLARAAARRNETAIRVVLGASRGRLAREALSETLVLGLLAAAAGALLARWGGQALLALSPSRIPHAAETLTFRVAGPALLLALLAAATAGLVAAWLASRGDLTRGLGAGMRQGSFVASRTRRVLVVAQVAITVMLLVNSGLLLRSFRALRYEATGFDPRNVLTLEIALPATRFPNAPARLAHYRQILQGVQAVPGVEHAGMVNYLPIHSGSYIVPVSVSEAAEGEDVTWSYRSATPDYFRSMGIPLLAGRHFTESDGPAAAPVAIVDRSAATRVVGSGTRIEAVIGRRVTVNLGEPVTYEIVGVVGDVRQQGLGIPSYPGFYLSAHQRTPAVMNLVVRSSSHAAGVASSVRNVVRAVNSGIPLGGLGLLEARISDTVARRRFAVVLSGVLSASALLVSMVGLFALMSQLVVHRTHEIGVRVALGARPLDVLRLVLHQGATIAGIGVAAGLTITVWTSSIVARLLYGVGSTDPATYVMVPLLVLLVAGVACSVPAVRALRASPVHALRRD